MNLRARIRGFIVDSFFVEELSDDDSFLRKSIIDSLGMLELIAFLEKKFGIKILRGGWLWTGDLASRDADGFFFHAGRAKEIFKVGGHRVGPAEIEHALERHPEVAEAAVVAVKSELASEAAAAFVVRRKGGAVGETELRRFCRELLPAYKVPATITFVEKLPRNAAGKLLRAQIAAPRSGEEGP